MNNFTKLLFACFCLSGVFLFGCKEEFDEYYARPEGLEGPVYQVLSDSVRFRGNFDHYLALVDRAGYKQTLSSAGYWTVFAPNDEAFEQYFEENGLSGIDDISDEKAYEIVTYSLVYNAYSMRDLGYYQTGPGNDTLSSSFRRKTAYYKGVYKDNVYGEELDVVDANRNGVATYSISDNNNKYIPYYVQHYLDRMELTAEDIEGFYDRPYTGAQVANANVVESNVSAENGYIHTVDRVIEPMPNIADYLKDKPEYSLFKSILEMEFRSRDNNTAVNYDATTYPELTERFAPVYDLAGPVYVKSYTGTYAFAPNNENFLSGGNIAQSDSWTLFAPTNEALQKFLDEVLLEYYGELANVPDPILFDFVNMHMWQTALWPSRFPLMTNLLNEEARFDPEADIEERKVLSNGLFYGTNQVQQGNFFFTVYSRPYLDPNYSIMLELLNSYRFTVSDPGQNFAMLLMSNQQLNDAGFVYDPGARDVWTYNGSASQAYERLIRMLELSIIKLGSPDELQDISGSGIVETLGGEYIRYENGQFFASGNVESGELIDVNEDETYEAINGRDFYTEGLVSYTEKVLAEIIMETPQFAKFAEYLEHSSIYNASTLQIEGVSPGQFFTVLVPSDEAIEAAVAAGTLPADPMTGDAAEREAITAFLKYHFVPRNTIVPDGKKIVSDNGEEFSTLLASLEGEIKKVVIDNSANGFQAPYTMTVTDLNGNVANVNIPESNVLASYAVLHQIDRVLESN
ncbi:fasciclin domain-containing protein [Echinicola vietnamensis]|uniref:Secreted/surface protein with fasciclin-like repeats n=1 Tax=Echinicola vietnamensis (strain DSM 17526 / LMG 23754 / KMM 6221) TaxID=926556 RepID=L0FVI7_ECHVK|nr:fasciclin domain-containing protein [Echinicola vietnamensis]AGA77914.1 secreted/surface protein with fasciclin-like repeats [Echinicola vietnamensis DSM 17526]